jgi:hypothetical protein
MYGGRGRQVVCAGSAANIALADEYIGSLHSFQAISVTGCYLVSAIWS